MTNKLLLEAGFSRFMFNGGTTGSVPPDGIFDLISVTEQSTAINRGDRTPLRAAGELRLSGGPDDQHQLRQPEHVARLGVVRHRVARPEGRLPGRLYPGELVYERTFPSRSCPTGSTRASRISSRSGCRRGCTADRTSTSALYIQDRWTRGRLTLQGALRYDRASSFSPAEHNGTTLTSKFNPAPYTFERTAGVDAFNDITPRMGVAYDVFGNGKTALKFNLGHYLDAATNDSEYTSNSPPLASFGRAARNWGDTNNNKVIDCDIMNFAQNGECSALTGNDAELREGQSDDNGEPGHAHGLGRPSKRLAVGDQRSAGGDAARVGGGRLQPPVVPRARR